MAAMPLSVGNFTDAKPEHLANALAPITKMALLITMAPEQHVRDGVRAFTQPTVSVVGAAVGVADGCAEGDTEGLVDG